MTYEIREDLDSFLLFVKSNWLKLVIMLIGESLPGCEYVII
jgi:hypothetical protein